MFHFHFLKSTQTFTQIGQIPWGATPVSPTVTIEPPEAPANVRVNFQTYKCTTSHDPLLCTDFVTIPALPDCQLLHSSRTFSALTARMPHYGLAFWWIVGPWGSGQAMCHISGFIHITPGRQFKFHIVCHILFSEIWTCWVHHSREFSDIFVANGETNRNEHLLQ